MFKFLPDLTEVPSADIILYKLMQAASEDNFTDPAKLPEYILQKLNAVEYCDGVEKPAESKWFVNTFLEVVNQEDNISNAHMLNYYMFGILAFIQQYRLKESRVAEGDLNHIYGIYKVNDQKYIIYEKTIKNN